MNRINLNDMNARELRKLQETIEAMIEAKQDAEREQEKKDVEELFIKGVIRDETKAAYTVKDIIEIALREELLKVCLDIYGRCDIDKIKVRRNNDFSISIVIDDSEIY